jgi:5-methylcytosine-specific restriction endonuclease McrA
MRKRIHPVNYTCKHCGKESKWKVQKENFFCNSQCFQDYKWVTETVPLIESGSKTITNKPALVKYVVNRDGYKCSTCGIADWLGALLLLDLDHIDGDNKNNLPSNLRLLCPNCHRQTPTWGNKKRSPIV